MKELLGKLLPTLAVVAVLGYCCWSEEDLPPTEDDRAARKTEPPTAALFPTPMPAPSRDPFHLPGEPATGKAHPGKSVVTPEKTPAGTSEKSALGAGTHRLTSGLVLRATYLRDDRRLALIN